MQQTIDAAEVDEDAVVGDVFHDAMRQFSFFETAECLLLLRSLFDFDDGATRQHDVAALLVE